MGKPKNEPLQTINRLALSRVFAPRLVHIVELFLRGLEPHIHCQRFACPGQSQKRAYPIVNPCKSQGRSQYDYAHPHVYTDLLKNLKFEKFPMAFTTQPPWNMFRPHPFVASAATPGPMTPCFGETRTAPMARSKAKFNGRFSWRTVPAVGIVRWLHDIMSSWYKVNILNIYISIYELGYPMHIYDIYICIYHLSAIEKRDNPLNGDLRSRFINHLRFVGWSSKASEQCQVPSVSDNSTRCKTQGRRGVADTADITHTLGPCQNLWWSKNS